MCECNDTEIKNLKAQVRTTDLAFRSAEAELSVVRCDLADTTKTLDKYRELRAKMGKALSVCTEERDLARELFQGMVSEYANLLDRYSKMCDDYGVVVSHVDAEHGKF